MTIHPTAIVHPEAELGEDVVVGPYSLIEAGVKIGARTKIDNHVKLCRGTKMGEDCRVHAHAVLGEDPQYIGFDSDLPTGVLIGDRCVFREHTTIHRSIYEGKDTLLENEVYMMVNAHVAHDCILHNNVILTNAALVAGHVEIGKNAYVGGGAAIHQFVRMGEGSMTGGVSRITQDLAPYLMASERDEVSGLNLIGLKRRGVSRESIKMLKELFHRLFKTEGNIRQQAQKELENLGDDLAPECRIFLEFFGEGKRGFCGVNLKSGK